MMNILFTSVGRRVELVRAFRRGYEKLQLPGKIIAVDVDPLAPALSMVDRSYVVPRLSTDEYLPYLASICQNEEVKLIFPLIDPDIPLLSRNRKVLERIGAEVVVVPEESAAIAADKWSTHEFLSDLHVEVPKAWLAGDLDPATAPYPLFIKPRHGSAGKDSFRVENAEQLLFFQEFIDEPIIEEFLPGPEITSDVICDLQGDVLAVVSRKRLEVRSGEVSKGVTVYDESILKACVRIAKALCGRGQITVQCIMKDGKPHFTEINARFGGGTPLAVAAGCDSPTWLLAQAAGIPLDLPQLGSYTVGLYITRYDDSFFLTEHEIQQKKNAIPYDLDATREGSRSSISSV